MDLKKILKQQHLAADAEFDQAVQGLKRKINVALLTGKTVDEIVSTPGFVEAVAAIKEHEREKASRS